MKIELFGLCALAVAALGAAPTTNAVAVAKTAKAAPKAVTKATNAPVKAATNTVAAAKSAPRADVLELGETTDAAVKLTVKKADKPGDKKALVDIDCENAPLSDILRQFRHSVGANIICTDTSNLQQRVSVSFHQVPWLDSLQLILNKGNLRLEPRDGIYIVNEITKVEPLYTRTYPLSHAAAEELAAMFNQNYGAKDAAGKVVKPVASAFVGANTLIVTANEQTLAECEAIIKAVDKAVAQIYIEARFIEASSEALHKLGLDWSALQSWQVQAQNMSMSFSSSTLRNNTTATTRGLQSQNGSSTERTTQSSSTTLTSSGSKSVDKTRTHNKETSDETGFSGTLSADDFKVALSAFESIEDAKVFSNPKIIVSNGKEAKVDMTTKFPNVRVQATRNTSNGSDSLDISTQLEVIPGEDKLMFAKEAFYSWGITLTVKPRISPDGLINVEIVPTISQLATDCPNTEGGFYSIKGGDSSAYSAFPVIGVKRLTTDFTMKDGSTAVIGGLSKTEEEDIDSGIPYLRKIPGIGPRLFGWKSRDKVQKEVIVFVTVGIADPGSLPADAGLPKNAVMGRQYVDGTKLEPGDREKPAKDILTLDQRALDDPERK